MKPTTFAQLLVNHAAEFVDGFKSGAQNEIYAQVILDRAIKQRWGASTEHPDFGGTKIREIPYDAPQNRHLTSDFAVVYHRPPNQDANNPFHIKNFVDKRTCYYVEIKTESGNTRGKFSSQSWSDALLSDAQKLQPISQRMDYYRFAEETLGYPRPLNKRIFAVLLSFHPQTTAKILANVATKFPSAVTSSAQVGSYHFCAVVLPV